MKIVSQNKKAFHDYFILETYEAGIELKGCLLYTSTNYGYFDSNY